MFKILLRAMEVPNPNFDVRGAELRSGDSLIVSERDPCKCPNLILEKPITYQKEVYVLPTFTLGGSSQPLLCGGSGGL